MGEASKYIIPEIGMGATFHIGPNKYPCTIVGIFYESKKKINITFDGSPARRLMYVSLRKNGRWVECGKSQRNEFFTIGERHRNINPLYIPSF